MLELLRKISGMHGVSGYEKKVSETLLAVMKNYTDEQYTDALGNLITVKHGKGKKKLMLCAHMDEIGFMATFIEESGLVRLAPGGGIGFAASS